MHHSVAFAEPFFIVYAGISTENTRHFLDDINLFDVRFQKWTNPITRKSCCNMQNQVVETMGRATGAGDVTALNDGQEGGRPASRADGRCAALPAGR